MVAGMCDARPCRPNSSPPRSPGGPTFLRPQVTRRPPRKEFSQPSPSDSWKAGATMPLGESQARGVPLCSARPTSMPRSGRMSKERPLPVLKRKALTPRAGPSSNTKGSIPATWSNLPIRLRSSLRVSGSPDGSVIMDLLLLGLAPEAFNTGRTSLFGERGDWGRGLGSLPDRAELPRARLLFRGTFDPRDARQAGRARRRGRRDLGDQRLQGNHGDVSQRVIQGTHAARARRGVPRRARGGGLARATFSAPDQISRRLPHASRPPACRRRDREGKARRTARQDGGLAHPLVG